MRLLTHSLLQCHVKKCQSPALLILSDISLDSVETDFNAEFLLSLLTKIDYPSLVIAAKSLDVLLPETVDESEAGLAQLHSLLLETRITEGKMTCGDCGHVYPITDSIANMLLNEDEV